MQRGEIKGQKQIKPKHDQISTGKSKLYTELKQVSHLCLLVYYTEYYKGYNEQSNEKALKAKFGRDPRTAIFAVVDITFSACWLLQ